MLTALAISNIVLIDALDLDFGGGLGVLTGETGAGKSILLDALGLALGRARRFGAGAPGVRARAGDGQLHRAVRRTARLRHCSPPMIWTLKRASR